MACAVRHAPSPGPLASFLLNRHPPRALPLQARYIVERADTGLWLKVLAEDNEHRRPLIDQAREGAGQAGARWAGPGWAAMDRS